MEVLPESRPRESVLALFSTACFLIFFQSYLVAPLVPSLMTEFSAPQNLVGYLVPAYMLPYGFATLFYGPLSDKIGRRRILLALLLAMPLATAGSSTAQNIHQLLIWRIAAGISTGGVIPISLALLADLFPAKNRGHAFGWMFGAIAGGMAFGSTFGALLNPFLGWRNVFLIIAALQLLNFLWALKLRQHLQGIINDHPLTIPATLKAYIKLLCTSRGLRTFTYTFSNGAFHAGIFSWLGPYFHHRYNLGDVGIGLALLGYGIPGLFLGPIVGKLADRFGRNHLIPLGLIVASFTAAALIFQLPLVAAALLCTLLSFGYDMSHPLLAGIVTSLDPARRGQSLSLNAFILFMGFGLGSLFFESLLKNDDYALPLAVFSSVLFILGLLALPLFRNEIPAHAHTTH